MTDARPVIEERGALRIVLELARSGLVGVWLYPLRSAVTIACVIAMLLPYLGGVGIARGLLDQAEDSIRFGADLYVTGVRFGRSAPAPSACADAIRAIPGVVAVVPRIVGEATLGTDSYPALVVGLPAEHFPAGLRCVDGRLPVAGERLELAAGSELSQRLRLSVGAAIPPFYRNRGGERVTHVVGIFQSDLPIWQAHILLTTFETASQLFDETGFASDLLVWCRPGYESAVATTIRRWPALDATGGREADDPTPPLAPWVVTRDECASLLPNRVLGDEGVFTLHFVLAFAVGIPLVLVATGFGLSERRRETGLLKAVGWRTDEILLRGLVESVVLALLGASSTVLLAWAWLEVFDGAGIVRIFVPEADRFPGFELPFRLMPEPVGMVTLVAVAVVASGSLWSLWRAAIAAPAEAMR